MCWLGKTDSEESLTGLLFLDHNPKPEGMLFPVLFPTRAAAPPPLPAVLGSLSEKGFFQDTSSPRRGNGQGAGR